jgi:hypothetical protein
MRNKLAWWGIMYALPEKVHVEDTLLQRQVQVYLCNGVA